MSYMRRGLVASAGMACLAVLASCGKLSTVGDQQEPQPVAVASSIGEKFTADADGNLTMTVRAGSDVILSGKESRKGEDDAGVPLIKFEWLQDAADTTRVHVIYRSSNTVSFVAPQVAADTTLHFTLSVNDAKGNTDTATAAVLVKNFRDTDHFLQYLNIADTVPVVLATRSPIAAAPSALATDNLPVTIKVTKLVTFKDRNGVLQQRIPVGETKSMASTWAKRFGTSSSCTATVTNDAASRNPVINVPVPRLDQDDVLQAPVTGFPEAVLLSDVLEPADVSDDAVVLEARIDIDASATDTSVLAATPALCIGTETTAVDTGAIRTTESLLATPANDNIRDSKAAAAAYYAAINPPGSETSKDTLDKWLAENGFDPAAQGWKADAHATYTNDFDLGFGRDMYMKFGGKTGKCDDGVTPLPVDASHLFGGGQGGACDVAAVVVNYVGVEAAAKKTNPVVAVAMEYSRVANSGNRFVKFYTFAPDRRTGELKRVLSVNLDRRGEQFMPQACVVCHGGTPKALVANAYANGGNVNAAFLPWDLDSLLYSDTDPGFSTKARDADLKASLTRANQESQLKLLNLGAYMTMSAADPTSRYALGRDLIEHWYGGGTGTSGVLASTSQYNDTATSSVPAGWLPTNYGNPADSAVIYKEVFARNCRMCHTVQVPVSGDPRQPSACAVSSPVANTTKQVPMACYWQFANAPSLSQALSEGRMPFARRSMDRLWTDATSWTDATNAARTGTKGDRLYDHLKTVYTANNQAAQVAALALPGTPKLSVALAPSSADVFDWVNLSAGTGLTNLGANLLSQPKWVLCTPVTAGTCAGATSVYPVVGSPTTTGRLQVPRAGSYVVELSSGTQVIAAAALDVPAKRPAIKALPGQVQRQGTITLSGDSLITAGNGPTGNALSQHRWWISNLQNLSLGGATNCTASSPCVVGNSSIVLMETDATASTGSYTVNVIDADDAATDPITATQGVGITSALTINARSGRVVANSSRGVVYQDSGSCTPNTLASCAQLDLTQGNVAASGSSFIAQICGFTSGSLCVTQNTVCSSSGTSGCLTTGINYASATGKAFLNGLQLQYTPPGAYATHPPSGTDSASAPATRTPDRLYYRLVRVDGTGTALDYSSWAAIDIKVLARKSFASDIVGNIFQRTTAYPSGGAACYGCHYSSYPGLPANALVFSSFSASTGITNLAASTIYSKLVPTAIGSDGKSATAAVQGNATRPYIDLGAPTTDSVLYMHPSDTDGFATGHTGSNRCPTSTSCDLTDVVTWIQDGANPF